MICSCIVFVPFVSRGGGGEIIGNSVDDDDDGWWKWLTHDNAYISQSPSRHIIVITSMQHVSRSHRSCLFCLSFSFFSPISSSHSHFFVSPFVHRWKKTKRYTTSLKLQHQLQKCVLDVIVAVMVDKRGAFCDGTSECNFHADHVHSPWPWGLLWHALINFHQNASPFPPDKPRTNDNMIFHTCSSSTNHHIRIFLMMIASHLLYVYLYICRCLYRAI